MVESTWIFLLVVLVWGRRKNLLRVVEKLEWSSVPFSLPENKISSLAPQPDKMNTTNFITLHYYDPTRPQYTKPVATYYPAGFISVLPNANLNRPSHVKNTYPLATFALISTFMFSLT